MAWREAASVILCTGANKIESDAMSKFSQTLRLLMLKRLSSSSFMANKYVFPGGVLDQADLNVKWLDRFPVFKEYPMPISNARIPIFKKYSDAPVPGELAFRLCAIRETFEECGILLSAKKPDHPVPMQSIETFGPDEWKIWRNRVKNDAMEFMTLFEKLNLLPDVWSLHEWSNWLTPATQKKRFDTVFFICCVPNIPTEIKVEESEMSDAKILSPQGYLWEHLKERLVLAPPQIYEMARLSKFTSVNQLEEFANKRATQGNARYNVVFGKSESKADENSYVLLPGDYQYPREVTEFTIFIKTNTSNETHNLNRLILPKKELLCNVSDHGHVIPITLDELISHRSKL